MEELANLKMVGQTIMVIIGKRLLQITVLLTLLLIGVGLSLRPGVEPSTQTWVEQVGLVMGEASLIGQEGEKILKAYEQVLREEGFPFRRVTWIELASLAPLQRSRQYQALILPEKINAVLPPGTKDLLREFVEAGGKVLLVFDPGSRSPEGNTLSVPLLADMAGVVYSPPYYEGYWRFPSPEVAWEWGITPGKLDKENVITGYGYGRLKFTHARTRLLDADEIAFDFPPEGRVAVLTQKFYSSGGVVVFANLKLGFHKLMSDDLTLRSVLRTFLIRFAHLPRLVNTPSGKGGIVLNFHLDSNAHLRPLRAMLHRKIFRPDLAYSIHITAGPDTYRPGDGLGFDAASPMKGRPWVKMLTSYGAIGAHGGWIHNYFAANLEKMPREEAFRYLELNFSTLEEITGEKVVEYSAPAGNHPPFVNKWLERKGALAYYSPGDTGSSPTRSFFRGEPVSGKLWAFPVTPFREYAALEELIAAKVPLEETKKWLKDLLEFIEKEHVIRLIYTHANRNEYALEALAYFAQRASLDQEGGKLLVWPMSRFAEFLNRYEGTKFSFHRGPGGWAIDLENAQGLKDLTVAVYVEEPSSYRVIGSGVDTRVEDNWMYITVTEDSTKTRILLRKKRWPPLQ
ncbi:hypothetical protein SAMN00808754_2765 [Thermanaeromonas toyohensis ToBE]|uniref:NodB homology domain-containing protein n=1 Tax=Thermanaeromonas toyohensis ToBE TaxID=698762 RepID=A0A1W1W0X2_9FIRM|nr:hypothetical protein [Thermanaeromonas toyohensis]SMB99140.1 hypothetical protein SAMN00808754_2765 [Thermanaeromonas toyohensis ToBE]